MFSKQNKYFIIASLDVSFQQPRISAVFIHCVMPNLFCDGTSHKKQMKTFYAKDTEVSLVCLLPPQESTQLNSLKSEPSYFQHKDVSWRVLPIYAYETHTETNRRLIQQPI